MLSFAIRRIVWTIPVLLVCVTILFGLVHATGSPLRHAPLLGLMNVESNGRYKSGDWKPAAITRNMQRRMGIDRPLYVQYGHYVESVARFDFGTAFSFHDRTVNDILREQGPYTLELVALALAWAFVLGIPLGVLAAVRHGSVADRLVTAVTAGAFGLPLFFVGTILLWLLSVKVHLVPTDGWVGWRAKLLPPLVLALVPFSMIARVVRASMLDLLSHDYVLAARAKGLRRTRIVGTHVLRPALIPVLSMSGPLVGQLGMGLFIVEWIYAIPGVGRYFIAAAGARDYPLILGLTIVLTEAVILINLLTDLALAAIDPRIRDAR